MSAPQVLAPPVDSPAEDDTDPDDLHPGKHTGDRTMRTAQLLFLVLGSTGMAWMVTHVDFSAMPTATTLAAILIPSIAAHVAGLVVDAYVLHHCTGAARFGSTLRASVLGHVVNSVTPGGSLGEVTKYDLMGAECARDSAAAGVLLSNFLSFAANCVVMSVGPCVLYAAAGARGVMATALLLSSPFFVIVASAFMVAVMRPDVSPPFFLLRRAGLAGPAAKLEKYWAGYVAARARIAGRALLKASLAAAASPFFAMIELAVILAGLGVDHWALMALVSLSTAQFVTLLTFFVPLQAGTAEGGAMLLFGSLGMPQELGLVAELLRKLRRIAVAGVGLPWLAMLHARRNGA